MYRHMRFFLPIGALFLLVGCMHARDELIAPESGLEGCDTLNISFTGTIVPILQANCALSGCHVPGGDGTGDLTTYAGVFSQVMNNNLVPAVQRTSGAIPMPPDGSMIDACDIARIRAWVEAGAPEN